MGLSAPHEDKVDVMVGVVAVVLLTLEADLSIVDDDPEPDWFTRIPR